MPLVRRRLKLGDVLVCVNHTLYWQGLTSGEKYVCVYLDNGHIANYIVHGESAALTIKTKRHAEVYNKTIFYEHVGVINDQGVQQRYDGCRFIAIDDYEVGGFHNEEDNS